MVGWQAGRGWRVAAVMIAGAAASLTACVNDKGAAPRSGAGTVRVIQVSPSAGVVDIVLDHTTAVAHAAFLIDTSLSVSAGSHTFAVDAPAGSGTTVLTTPIAVSTQVAYDLLLAGPMSSLQLVGGQVPPPGFDLSSQAAVRLFNVVADTGTSFASSIDVYFTDSTGSFATAKYAYLNVALFASPVANGNGDAIYFPVGPGTYRLKVTAPGDTTTLAVDSAIVLVAGQQRTVVVAPSADQAAGSLVIVPDAN